MALVKIKQINNSPASTGGIVVYDGTNNVWSNNDNNAILVSSGTTGQRPTGVNGMIRYNTTNDCLETYESGSWTCIKTFNTPNNLTTVTSYAGLPGSPTVNDQVFYTPFNSVLTWDGSHWVGPKITTPIFGRVASANQSTWLDAIGGASAHPDGTNSHGYWVPNITSGSVTNSGWKIYAMSADNTQSVTGDVEIHAGVTAAGTPTYGTTGLIRVQISAGFGGQTELASPTTVNGGSFIQGFYRKNAGNPRNITTMLTYSMFARA